MAENQRKGREGEDLARDYLEEKGCFIREQNWRSGHKEIDIIAEKGGELIIVEVKLRKSIGGERLEEHVTRRKQQFLILAAGAYLNYSGLDLEVRFDIILITGEGKSRKIEHIENAFSPWDMV